MPNAQGFLHKILGRHLNSYSMKSIVKSFITVLLAAAVVACGNESDPLASLKPATGARLRFYHAAPDAPGLALYLNNKAFSGVNTVPTTPDPLPAAVTYFSAFPVRNYAAVEPGTATLKINAAKMTTAEEAALWGANLTLEDGKYYSVFAAGNASAYEVISVEDNRTVADAGKAYVRVANLVVNSPAGGYEVAINGKVITTVSAYKSITNFIAIDPVAFNSAAQTITAKNGSVTLTSASADRIQPYAGRFYTIILRGVAGDTKTPPTISLPLDI
ncbi:hypothetical protein BWI96_17155 [Siphonobacter sp. SORGH_AS_0500]|nr:hypothetical protein BWI96_17155 [Siphonobacter sp. SORGH_AS_0500]